MKPSHTAPGLQRGTEHPHTQDGKIQLKLPPSKKKKTTTLPYNSSMEKKRQEGMRWFRVIYTAEYFK